LVAQILIDHVRTKRIMTKIAIIMGRRVGNNEAAWFVYGSVGGADLAAVDGRIANC
jgi:hypothetical protein